MKKVNPKTIEIYSENCRYLKEVEMDFPIMRGIFEIEGSYYVKETGHFNAVEVCIAYNQLAYEFFIESLSKGLIPEMGVISPEYFLENHQLLHTYIAKINEMTFRKPFDKKRFFGKLELLQYRKKFCRTSFEFKDNNSGHIDGKILLAFSENA